MTASTTLEDYRPATIILGACHLPSDFGACAQLNARSGYYPGLASIVANRLTHRSLRGADMRHLLAIQTMRERETRFELATSTLERKASYSEYKSAREGHSVNRLGFC